MRRALIAVTPGILTKKRSAGSGSRAPGRAAGLGLPSVVAVTKMFNQTSADMNSNRARPDGDRYSQVVGRNGGLGESDSATKANSPVTTTSKRSGRAVAGLGRNCS